MKKELTVGWCLIPPYIVASDLSANEKLVYGRIMGLTGKRGYCDASNFWLGKQLNLDDGTVKNIVVSLKKKGLLEVNLKRDSSHKVTKRFIFIKHSSINACSFEHGPVLESGTIKALDNASNSVVSVENSGDFLIKNRKTGKDLLTSRSKIRKAKENKKNAPYRSFEFTPKSQKKETFERKKRTIVHAEGVV